MTPSPVDIQAELRLLDQVYVETDADEIFFAGVRRTLEWVQGKGVSPTEFVKMCQRLPMRH